MPSVVALKFSGGIGDLPVGSKRPHAQTQNIGLAVDASPKSDLTNAAKPAPKASIRSCRQSRGSACTIQSDGVLATSMSEKPMVRILAIVTGDSGGS